MEGKRVLVGAYRSAAAARARTAEERAEKATPGPWAWGLETPDGGPELMNPETVFLFASDGHLNVSEEDAEFIVHAREDVPALAADVLALIEVITDSSGGQVDE